MIEKLGITPGPWSLMDWSNDGAKRLFSGNIYLGTVYNSDMNKQQIYRNAGLVAAAPEMLEQLLHAALAHEAETGVRHASVPTIEKATGRTWKEFKQILEEDV